MREAEWSRAARADLQAESESGVWATGSVGEIGSERSAPTKPNEVACFVHHTLEAQ